MNKKYEHLFQPITIRGITFKNRIEASPVSLYDVACTPEHHVSKDAVGFYRVRAAGGAAIVTLGDSIVHPSGVDSGHLPSPKVMMCNDDNIPFLRDITDEIHRSGAVASIQLNHAGMLSTSAEFSGWGPDYVDFSEVTLAAALSDQAEEGQSNVRRGIVQYMTEDMIEEIVEAYGTSAARAKLCGFDMVMIHAGHGWLIHQFLSPHTNHRTDRFGGCLENRARLLCMILERIRQYCGEDFVIETRISGTEYVEGGHNLEEAIQLAKMIEDKTDMLHVSAATFVYPQTEHLMTPTIFTEACHNVYLAEEMKKHVNIPVSTVGAIMNPDQMEEIIASGKADFVASARALIADPQMPNKARRGQEEDIRPCIRCTFCLADYQNRTLRCSVNPVIHRPWETIYAPMPTTPKKVLIAGGGPGGMQAAITAKERGHEVILCEKRHELGGLIRYSKSIPFKYEMKEYMEYLIRQIHKKGIEVRLNTEVTPQLVEQIAPDHLIAAVGAEAVMPPISGIEKAHMLMDVYDHKPDLGEKVVIVGGGLAGTEAALELAMEKKHVVLLEMGNAIAKDANPLHGSALFVTLEEYKDFIDIRTSTMCLEITEQGVSCMNGEREREIIPADAVIIAAGMRAQKEVVEALWNACDEFEYIGDCRKPRLIRQAVLEGYNAAMNI